MTLRERADPEHRNHFLALVNAEPALSSLAASARMQLAVAPSFNRYMLDLERENKALWRANQRLARDTGAIADSAAASTADAENTESEVSGVARAGRGTGTSGPKRRGRSS